MTYTFEDDGNGSLVIKIDGDFVASIHASKISYKKNVAQSYVELTDGEKNFFGINISEVSGANDLDDVVQAIEDALPDESSGGGGPSTSDLLVFTGADFSGSTYSNSKFNGKTADTDFVIMAGQRLVAGTDYTHSGNDLVWAVAPQSDEVFTAIFK